MFTDTNIIILNKKTNYLRNVSN